MAGSFILPSSFRVHDRRHCFITATMTVTKKPEHLDKVGIKECNVQGYCTSLREKFRSRANNLSKTNLDIVDETVGWSLTTIECQNLLSLGSHRHSRDKSGT